MSKILKRRMKVSAAKKVMAVMSLAAFPAAYAQAATTEPVQMKPVVVTGSLIPTAETVGATPVDVFSIEQIERTGAETVTQLLRKLPVTMGTGNFNESSGNGGDGTARVELRGIPGGTLVLINGRRVAPTAFAGSAVDLNSIPLAAIERVEILKDGGSSLYGSDAVAGVVNIILKKNLNGTVVDAYYGNTTKTDVGQQTYSFVTGFSNEKTSLLVGGSYYKANALYSNDRERSFGGGTSPTSNPGRFRVRNDARGGGLLYDPARAADAQFFVTANRTAVPGEGGRFTPADYHVHGVADNPESLYPGDTFPFPLYTPAVRPSERYSLFANASHQLFDNEAVEFFAEASYTKSDTYNQLAATPISSGNVGYPIPANNYYNPFGADVASWNYRTVELGPRTDAIVYDYYRFVPGLRGRIGETSWNWEVAMLYSESRGVERLGGELSRARLQTALNDTTPGAFNVFGIERNNAAQLAAVQQPLFALGKSTIWSVDAHTRGEIFDLPAGPLAFAAGVSHSREKGESIPDGPTQAADTVGFNSATVLMGERRVNAIFGEISVPVFSEQKSAPGLHSLTLGASFRYSDYSDFGETVDPKFTLRWQPVDETITVRGSYSTSFRAPTFEDLYTARQQNFPEIRNPYNTVFEQISTFDVGNPFLLPQEADNYTAGIVWSPSLEALKGLTIALDWFRIEQETVPGGSGQFVVDENARSGGPANAVPNPAYNPALPVSETNLPLMAGVNPTPGTYANLITFDPVNNTYLGLDVPVLNLSQTAIEGVDFAVHYEMPTDSVGTFNFGLNAAYYYKFEQETIPNSGMKDRLGDFSVDDFGFGSLPRAKGNVSLFWNLKGLEFGVTANYIHSYLDDKLSGFDREIESIVTVDLQASYDLTGNTPYRWADATRITIGVLNVSDEPPPFAGAAFADNYDRTLHDLRQRFV